MSDRTSGRGRLSRASSFVAFLPPGMAIFVAALAILVAGLAGCADAPDATEEPTAAGPLLITDRSGRSWDVTHAYEEYGMDPAHFNYGLGLGAIPSVDEPTVRSEGDPGYPQPDSRTAVFGVVRNGEARAYSVSQLRAREVFNDRFPGKSDEYVAVAY